MKNKAPAKGEPITAAFLNELAQEVARRTLGGQGIYVERTGAGMVIKLAQNQVFGGGSQPRWQPYSGE